MATNLLKNGSFEDASEEDLPAEWKSIKQSAKRNVKISIDRKVSCKGQSSLRMSGKGNPWCYGRIKQHCKELEPGKTYLFKGCYRFENVEHPRLSIGIDFAWRGHPHKYEALSCPPVAEEREWTKMERVFTAPDENVKGLLIEPVFQWSEGTVWWDDFSLVEIPPPTARKVRVCTIYWRPQTRGPVERNLKEWLRLMDEASREKPDIVCLPEASMRIMVEAEKMSIKQAIPGPVTEILGAKAKEHGFYIVAGIDEADNGLFYNTAVLIDRKGEVVGKYRKTHLAAGEDEDGVTPGSSYPVFKTDFGKIGMMICYDSNFPEVGRLLALNGAEIIFFPCWGSGDVVIRARAVENHVYVVSSSFDYRCCVIDPLGEIIAEVDKGSEKSFVVKEIVIDKSDYMPYMGDFSTLIWKKRRVDTYAPLLGKFVPAK